MRIKLRNLNNGIRNKRSVMDISGYIGRLPNNMDKGFPPTIHIYYDFGVLAGGFHTDLESAEKLRDVLNEQIKYVKTHQEGR